MVLFNTVNTSVRAFMLLPFIYFNVTFVCHYSFTQFRFLSLLCFCCLSVCKLGLFRIKSGSEKWNLVRPSRVLRSVHPCTVGRSAILVPSGEVIPDKRDSSRHSCIHIFSSRFHCWMNVHFWTMKSWPVLHAPYTPLSKNSLPVLHTPVHPFPKVAVITSIFWNIFTDGAIYFLRMQVAPLSDMQGTVLLTRLTAGSSIEVTGVEMEYHCNVSNVFEHYGFRSAREEWWSRMIIYFAHVNCILWSIETVTSE